MLRVLDCNKGKPYKDEYHGWLWHVCSESDSSGADPVVIVPDPGDGSAKPLAIEIAEWLNSRRGKQ